MYRAIKPEPSQFLRFRKVSTLAIRGDGVGNFGRETARRYRRHLTTYSISRGLRGGPAVLRPLGLPFLHPVGPVRVRVQVHERGSGLFSAALVPGRLLADMRHHFLVAVDQVRLAVRVLLLPHESSTDLRADAAQGEALVAGTV